MRFVVLIMMLICGMLAIFYLNPRVWAADRPAPTKVLMGKFLSEMVVLKPFMVEDASFSDPKNFKTIDSHLKALSSLATSASHDPTLQAIGYRLSRQVLQNHIAETEAVFKSGNKSYARWMLNSTLSICMSCHTQQPTVSREFKNFENTESFIKPFDQAEFLFATRAFDQAIKIYDKAITEYSSQKLTFEQTETALQRTVAYYARIKRDPTSALIALRKYQTVKGLPTALKEDIKSWIDAFNDWDKRPSIDPTHATDVEVLSFAKSNLDPQVSGFIMTADNPRAALYFKVSGILYQYMLQHPKSPATPELLYWLAICDKGLNNNFFYSLGDIYLRECIVSFPHSGVAQKCYDEYEAETLVSYSGSSGTHVPDDVSTDLGHLRALIATSAPLTGASH